MKTAFVLAATIAVASAATCEIAKLGSLASDPRGPACATASGYSLTSMKAPSADEIKKICGSDDCLGLLKAVRGLLPEDCSIGSIPSVHGLLDSVKCEAPAPAATTKAAAPVATTAAPAPAATTAAPSKQQQQQQTKPAKKNC